MVTDEEKPKRKGRGPSNRPTLYLTSIRIPPHVKEYFEKNHPFSRQAMMREVLVRYVDEQLKRGEQSE
jgi:hypothetical protein